MKNTSQSNTKTQKIQPLGDRVLIREFEDGKETTTKSGIIIPVNAQEDKGSKRGEVVAVGIGKYENGKLIPITVRVGDQVLFQWGDKIRYDASEYYLVRENEILAIIK